jgi:hypothetical protein
MKTATRLATIAALVASSLAVSLAAPLSGALAAPHHRTTYRPYVPPPHAPVRITIYPRYPGRIDFSRYIDPISGMYCRNTGWAAECVPPPVTTRGLDCAAAWPFPVCRSF